MIKKKNIIPIAACLFLLLIACNAYAIYFVIQLKNGNEVRTDKYWKEGENILFYANSGVVGIPEKIIKQIVSSTGSMEMQEQEPAGEAEGALSEEMDIKEVRAPKVDQEKKDSYVEDLKDRIAVIQSNLDSLSRNRTVYANQKEQLQQQKQKADERIAQLKNNAFVTPKDQKDSLDFEESKLKDLQDKINDLDAKMQTNEKMFEAQDRMRIRIEGEMAQMGQQ